MLDAEPGLGRPQRAQANVEGGGVDPSLLVRRGIEVAPPCQAVNRSGPRLGLDHHDLGNPEGGPEIELLERLVVRAADLEHRERRALEAAAADQLGTIEREEDEVRDAVVATARTWPVDLGLVKHLDAQLGEERLEEGMEL